MDQTLFQIAVGLAGAMAGWWMKHLDDAVKELRTTDRELTRNLSDLNAKLSGNYLTVEQFNGTAKRMFDKLDELRVELANAKVDKAVCDARMQVHDRRGDQ